MTSAGMPSGMSSGKSTAGKSTAAEMSAAEPAGACMTRAVCGLTAVTYRTGMIPASAIIVIVLRNHY